MRYIMLLSLFIGGYCYAIRNPFVFGATPQSVTNSIVGRGLIHDKQMVCEAYTAVDGSIKLRWIPQIIVAKKSPST